MTQRYRKYFTEVSLSIATQNSMVFRPSVLQLVHKADPIFKEVVETASIYLICTKPRVRIRPDSIERDGEDLLYELVVDTDSGRIGKEAVFSKFFSRDLRVTDVGINKKLSFLVDVTLGDPERPAMIPVDEFVFSHLFPDQHLDRYEVVYVGQSRIGKSSGNILSRLQNHSTLQSVLGDVHANSPHREVFLMCFQIAEPRYIMTMDPHARVLTSDEEDVQHTAYTLTNVPSSQQVTSIAEACYIRYFQPQYNRLLKDSFPSSDLKLLRSCFDLDFNAIVAEMNTEDLDGAVYSEGISPKYHHIITFDLHSHENRQSFFEMSTKEGDGINMLTPLDGT